VEGELQLVVGRNLRAHRRLLGLSQEGLGDLLGVHRTYVGGLERGEHNLTLRSLERLAGRLGLDVRKLILPD
jgi:transcriptional regulator with XRE-family HTH domain